MLANQLRINLCNHNYYDSHDLRSDWTRCRIQLPLMHYPSSVVLVDLFWIKLQMFQFCWSWFRRNCPLQTESKIKLNRLVNPSDLSMYQPIMKTTKPVPDHDCFWVSKIMILERWGFAETLLLCFIRADIKPLWSTQIFSYVPCLRCRYMQMELCKA